MQLYRALRITNMVTLVLFQGLYYKIDICVLRSERLTITVFFMFKIRGYRYHSIQK